jgi:hypothetical protein
MDLPDWFFSFSTAHSFVILTLTLFDTKGTPGLELPSLLSTAAMVPHSHRQGIKLVIEPLVVISTRGGGMKRVMRCCYSWWRKPLLVLGGLRFT